MGSLQPVSTTWRHASRSSYIAVPIIPKHLRRINRNVYGEMLNERDIERIWFGCGNFGGIGSSPRLLSAGDSEQQALRLLDHARRVGLRRFDTANTYGGGASEIVLGKWLDDQGASFMQDAQIATKVGNPHGCPTGDTPLSKTQIFWHLAQSLQRLGVERIDLYYLHEFDRVTPLEETLEA